MSAPPRSPRPVALITGGARRVGRAAALALARAGCDVVITYRTSDDEAQAAIAEAVTLGASPEVSRALRLDLNDLASITPFCDSLIQQVPRLDILILNASTYDQTPLDSLTPDQLLAAYRVNAAGAALLAARLGPALGKHAVRTPSPGAIVAMADIHALGEHGLPRARGYLAYAMSKAALMEMVRTLARELAPRVRVNAVAPGVVEWPEDGPDADLAARQAYLKKVPLARAGTPEEAAELIRWLALDATYITGQVVRIDGGRTLL